MKIGSIRKTYGERIRFQRRKRGMTQKALGLELGFPENSADVRIAQYETGARSPGEETLKMIAEKLYVSPAALEVPDMTVDEVMHFLFAMEDRYGIRPHVSIDGKFTGP